MQATCGLLMVVNAKWSRAPGRTVKLPLVPVFVPPWSVTVMVSPVPASVTATLWTESTPAVNALEVGGVIVPAVVVKSTSPV